MPSLRHVALLAALSAALPVAGAEPPNDTLSYPPAHKGTVVEDYHGVKVADPYRWLEKADAPETVAWVDAENKLTRAQLDRPQRAAIRAAAQPR